MSLTTNLKKLFESHFRSELGLDILRSNNQPGTAAEGAGDTLGPADSTAG